MAITEHKNHKVAEDGWKKSVDGTCMVAGKEEGICTLCSEPDTRDTTIDPNNHKLVTTIVKKATCTQTGEAKVTCARNYCNLSYVEDGYVKIGDCINDCVDKNEGLNYYYRTINNDDPFPQREAHYNWIGYEEYITDDDDDSTPSRGGSHPEYEIKLDKERMAKINQNTYNYNSGSGNTAYSDYIRVNSTDTGKYKSKFIHVDDPNDGGFKTYFTYIEGSKVGG
jgi:hypothetical protein